MPYYRPKRKMGGTIPLVNYDVTFKVKTGRFINIAQTFPALPGKDYKLQR